jgi:hypothetical protein
MLLIRNNIINDLNISLDSFYSERELIEEWFIEVNNNNKEFKLDSMFKWYGDALSLNEDWTLNKKVLNIFICKNILKSLNDYYWENQLNEDLNQDDSYKQLICYTTDKKKLDEILLNIKQNWDKKIIEKFEIKQDNIYINWETFNIKDSIKTPGFIKLLSWYLVSTNTKRIALSKLIDFYNDNYKKKNNELLILTIGNIKSTFIKTIRKQVWKKYLNNEILKIEWSDIVLL